MARIEHWSFSRNADGRVEMSNSNDISFQPAHSRSNLNLQLEANGFSKEECDEVWNQLAATGEASIRIFVPGQVIRQLNF